MPRPRHHHRVACDDPDQYVLISPSDRVVIDICATHGFRIKVDGRVVARARGPFEPSRVLPEIERAASSGPAVPAAELRAFARPD